MYPSSHDHGSGKWVAPILVSFHLGVIFHVHDYGRKGNVPGKKIREWRKFCPVYRVTWSSNCGGQRALPEAILPKHQFRIGNPPKIISQKTTQVMVGCWIVWSFYMNTCSWQHIIQKGISEQKKTTYNFEVKDCGLNWLKLVYHTSPFPHPRPSKKWRNPPLDSTDDNDHVAYHFGFLGRYHRRASDRCAPAVGRGGEASRCGRMWCATISTTTLLGRWKWIGRWEFEFFETSNFGIGDIEFWTSRWRRRQGIDWSLQKWIWNRSWASSSFTSKSQCKGSKLVFAQWTNAFAFCQPNGKSTLGGLIVGGRGRSRCSSAWCNGLICGSCQWQAWSRTFAHSCRGKSRFAGNRHWIRWTSWELCCYFCGVSLLTFLPGKKERSKSLELFETLKRCFFNCQISGGFLRTLV